MKRMTDSSRTHRCAIRPARKICFAFALAVAFSAAVVQAQTANPAPATDTAVPAPASDPVQAPAAAKPKEPELTEDELKQRFEGKALYLRSGYLDNSLTFDEHGKLSGHSAQGSYTLSLIQVEKVHLSKRKVELAGYRYGLHFLGALPNEDPTKASDKVRITPKKKIVKITIDRELVVTPKKKKKEEQQPGKDGADKAGVPPATEEAKIDATSAPAVEAPADANGVTTTTDPGHSAHLTREAIDKIFATNLDDQMIAAMPGFWKLYYQAVAAQSDYRPTDPSVFRQSAVDQKAKLVSALEPPSNEFAQACGVVGMALYHTVIGADGTPQEIVVARPIGFGLDENAADAIRKAKFEPALKDGKPVPVMLDVVVQFRIYSKRTDQPAKPDTDEASAAPKLPGPYSVQQP